MSEVLTVQSGTTEIRERLEEPESEIQSPNYARLNLIAKDSYIFYESESGAVEQYRGMIWSDKVYHSAGMTELLLMQRQNLRGVLEEWTPFVFHSKDPQISASSLMDLVPRVAVDSNARARIGRIVNWVSWAIIALLLYIIFFDVQIFLTFAFMGMLFFAAASIVIALFYEKKRLQEDLVYTATIFQTAPKVPISRSFVHPVTSDIKRNFWEVIPIQIKSSKITFSKIRGFGTSDMRHLLEYVQEIEDFKRAYYQLEIERGKFENLDDLTDEEKQDYESYQEANKQLKKKRHDILKKYSALITESDFVQLIEDAQKALADEQKRQEIIEYLEYDDAEIQHLHTIKSQLEIERDKYQKEAESWMRAANSDVNKFNITVAAKLTKIIKEGALVDMYAPEKMTNNVTNPLSGVNGILASAMSSLVPFVLVFVIGMVVFNSIRNSLAKLGEWASFIYLLILTLISIGAAIFLFNYAKFRLVDKMKNQEQSQKVVHR